MKFFKRGLSLFTAIATVLSFCAAMSLSVGAVTHLPCQMQKISKWKGVYVGDQTSSDVYSSACGIFALVNAVGYATGNAMDILETANWAYSIGGYKPGNGGTYRAALYPYATAKYGAQYGFKIDCGTNGAGYYGNSYSTALKNHLANGGTAVGHVYGHFIAIVGYDTSTDKYHIYESYPSSTRGTQNATDGNYYCTAATFNSGNLSLDWWCYVTATGTASTDTETQPFRTFYYKTDGNTDTADSSMNDFTGYGLSCPGGYINSPSNIGANCTLYTQWSAVAGELTEDCTLTNRGTEYLSNVPIRLFLDGRSLTAISSGYAFSQEKANDTLITGNTFAVNSAEGTYSMGTVNGNGNSDTVAQSAGTLTLKNLIISSDCSSGNINAFYQSAGTAAFNGVTFNASGNAYGAAVGTKGTVSSVTDCDFNNSRPVSSNVDMACAYHLRGGSIGTWTNSDVTSAYGDGLWVDGGTVGTVSGGVFTGGVNCNGLFVDNGGSVGTISGGTFTSKGGNAGLKISSGSSVNGITGGTFYGVNVAGSIGSVTGGTFDFGTYTTSTYNTISGYIASGYIARLDSVSGSGKFTVVEDSALGQGTYMSAPVSASYTCGTTVIGGISYTTYVVSEGDTPSQDVPVTNIVLDTSSVTIAPSGSVRITATVYPTDATDNAITWKSSDTAIATVSGGTVTGVADGTAVITASAGGKSATCSVTVRQISSESVTVTLNKGYAAVNKGDTTTLTATSTGGAVTWSSSDTSVATVNNGVVTGVGDGTATVSATSGSTTAKATVRVTDYSSPMWGVDVSKHQGTVDWAKMKQSGVKFAIIRLGYSNSDGSVTLDSQWATNVAGARAAGIDIGVYLYSYVTSASVAKTEAANVISELSKYAGYFTYPVWYDFESSGATSNTKAVNTAIIENFCEALTNAGYYVGIYSYQYYFSSYLNDSDLTAYDHWIASYGTNDGEAHTLSYTGSYGMWQYTSAGAGKVSSGTVESTGLDLNYAYKNYPKIIINNGLNGFDNSAVSVTSGGNSDVAVTGVSLDSEKITLNVGASSGLIATVSPSNATNGTVTWSSSDTSVATVSDGSVTAVKAGTAIITATAGSKSATCTVTVTATTSGTYYPSVYSNSYINEYDSTGKYVDVWSSLAGILTGDGDSNDGSFGQFPADFTSGTLEVTAKRTVGFDLYMAGHTFTGTNSNVALRFKGANVPLAIYGGTKTDPDSSMGKIRGAVGSDVLVTYTSWTDSNTLKLYNIDVLCTASAASANANAFWHRAGTVQLIDGCNFVSSVSNGAALHMQNAAKVTAINNSVFKNTSTTFYTDTSGNTTSDAASAIHVESNATIDTIRGNETLVTSKMSHGLWNQGTVKNIAGGTFSTENTSGFCGVMNDGTINLISGGYFVNFRNNGTIGSVTGGTFNYISLKWNFEDNVAPYIASGYIASVDSTEGNGIFSVVPDNGITSGTYYGKAPECASGYGYTQGTVSINGRTVNIYTVKQTGTPVTSVTLSDSEVTLVMGGNYTLTATVLPDNASDKTVSWLSTDTDTVTVVNGKLIPVNVGTATVIATAGGKSASCNVSVINEYVHISSLEISDTKLALETGDTSQLTVSVLPANATASTLSWSTSDSDVVSVVDGKVTAKSAGIAIITAYADGKTVTCEVIVTEPVVEVQSITINKSSLSVNKGASATVTATVLPANAAYDELNWISSDTSVATVTDGIIYAVDNGTAKITVKYGDIVSNTLTVTVSDGRYDVSLYKDEDGYPEISGKIFAGWFEDADNKYEYTSDTGYAYAKHVDEAVLAVKHQYGYGATRADSTVDLRFITTVADTRLKCVGFVIMYGGKTVTVNCKNVYSSIGGTVTGKSVTYLPTAFSDESSYFATYVLKDIPQSVYGQTIRVKPYWVTLDGTSVYGSIKSIVIDEQLPSGVTSVSLNKSSVSLVEGKTETLIATASPVDADSVTWSSSDTSVATVNDGVVTAVKAGTATITVTADGTTDMCTVTVTAPVADSAYVKYQKSLYPDYVESDVGLDITFKEDLVGICYSTWHTYAHVKNGGKIYNISEILAAGGTIGTSLSGAWGNLYDFHYWAKPALGYYESTDTSVIRTHMTQLAAAGVDFIIIDNTNLTQAIMTDHAANIIYNPVTALLDTCVQMRSEGLDTPYVVFWNRTASDTGTYINDYCYQSFLKKDAYKDLFVYWRNDVYGTATPLIIGTGNTDATHNTSVASTTKYTYKDMWGLIGGTSKWSYLNPTNTPRVSSTDGTNTFYEQISVSTAMQQNVMSNTTGSAGAKGRNGGQTFQTQWSRAFNYRPKIVTITWWNEWEAEMQYISLKYGSSVQSVYCFVDNFTQEYSRDIEPMSGGHGDKYYKMMCDYIAAYKAHNTCPTKLIANY